MTTTSYAAYSVYTYLTDPTSAMAGTLQDDGSAVTGQPDMRIEDDTTDMRVAGLVAPDGTSLRVITEVYGSTGVQVFDATDHNPEGTQTWTGLNNLWGAVSLGDYVYALDYDNARVIEVNPANWNDTGNYFAFDEDPVTQALYNPLVDHPNGVALLKIGADLYGLFTIADSTWENYEASILVKLTIDPGSMGSIVVEEGDFNNTLEKNAGTMAANGTDIYVACIGGYQTAGAPNENTVLQKVDTTDIDANAAIIMDFADTGELYEYRGIAFKGSTAYVLMGAFDNGYVMEGKLVQTTNFSTLTTVDNFTGGAPGYCWSVAYAPAYQRIWMGRGNTVRVYDSTANPPSEVDTLGCVVGELISTGEAYDNLNLLSYVGADGSTAPFSGYYSPLQASRSAYALAARGIAEGRPVLSWRERRRVKALLAAEKAKA